MAANGISEVRKNVPFEILIGIFGSNDVTFDKYMRVALADPSSTFIAEKHEPPDLSPTSEVSDIESETESTTQSRGRDELSMGGGERMAQNYKRNNVIRELNERL